MTRAKILICWVQGYAIGFPIGVVGYLSTFLPGALPAIWKAAQPLSQFFDRGLVGSIKWLAWIESQLAWHWDWRGMITPFVGAAAAIVVSTVLEALNNKKAAANAKPN